LLTRNVRHTHMWCQDQILAICLEADHEQYRGPPGVHGKTLILYLYLVTRNNRLGIGTVCDKHWIISNYLYGNILDLLSHRMKYIQQYNG
jgi:hypothetical protein